MAAEAVVACAVGVDVEGAGALLVEGAEGVPVRAGFAELEVLAENADDVSLLLYGLGEAVGHGVCHQCRSTCGHACTHRPPSRQATTKGKAKGTKGHHGFGGVAWCDCGLESSARRLVDQVESELHDTRSAVLLIRRWLYFCRRCSCRRAGVSFALQRHSFFAPRGHTVSLQKAARDDSNTLQQDWGSCDSWPLAHRAETRAKVALELEGASMKNNDISRNFSCRLVWFAAYGFVPLLKAEAAVVISVGFGPPALPVYVQPVCAFARLPLDAWVLGLWSGWVLLGSWCVGPTALELVCFGRRPIWGWENGAYLFHGGYWGPHVGFYGGINYGFGYTGIGFGRRRVEGWAPSFTTVRSRT